MDDGAGGAPVLVIDTAGARCAAAVVRGGTSLAERSEPMARGHAERLMPMVAEVLAQAGLAPSALGAVVVCSGPGGFTGVRIGVAAARGLALGLGTEARGIDLFAALAHGHCGPVRVVLPGGAAVPFAQDFVDGRPVGPAGPAAALPPATGAVLGGDSLPEPPLALLACAGLGPAATVPARPLYLRPPDAQPSEAEPPRIIG